jgi:hypothetical protein
MRAQKGVAWVVEYGKVRVDDVLVRTVRNEIVVDGPLSGDLARYDIHELRAMGYKIFRPCARKSKESSATATNS